jgi:hypothetical protein
MKDDHPARPEFRILTPGGSSSRAGWTRPRRPAPHRRGQLQDASFSQLLVRAASLGRDGVGSKRHRLAPLLFERTSLIASARPAPPDRHDWAGYHARDALDSLARHRMPSKDFTSHCLQRCTTICHRGARGPRTQLPPPCRTPRAENTLTAPDTHAHTNASQHTLAPGRAPTWCRKSAPRT